MVSGTIENPLEKHKLSDTRFVAIVLAVYWIPEAVKPYYIEDGDYVVCEWSDYHDGMKSNIEGKTTVAICKLFEDAKLIFKRHKG